MHSTLNYTCLTQPWLRETPENKSGHGPANPSNEYALVHSSRKLCVSSTPCSHALVSVYTEFCRGDSLTRQIGTDDFPFGAIDAFPENTESKSV